MNWAIARITGIGTIDSPYYCDTDGIGGRVIIPVHMSGVDRGKPIFNWCLVRLRDYDNETGTELFKFPNLSLDTQVRDISATRRNNINTKLQSLGIDTSWITLDTTLKEVILYVGRTLDVSLRDEDID